MSALGSPSPLFLASAAAADTAANITKSVRFNDDDSAHLTRTPSSAGDQQTWTWSAWIKGCTGVNNQVLFSTRGFNTTSDYVYFGIMNTGFIRVEFRDGTTLSRNNTNNLLRDPAAWYHIVVQANTSASAAADRMKCWVNNEEVSWSADDRSDISTSHNYAVNKASEPHAIGALYDSSYTDFFDGYMADVYLIDGSALDPTSFGAYDDNGVWQAAAYSGTFGTNGFHLFDFANESTVGHDSSGNNNDFTANNISTTAGAGNDVLFDVPTNGTQSDTGAGGEVSGNYATLNPLSKHSSVIHSEGNLKFSSGSTNVYKNSKSTIGVSSGKWYAEFTVDTSPVYIGIGLDQLPAASWIGNSVYGWAYHPNGQVYHNNSGSSYGATFASGDIIGLAFDADNRTATWYKNGASQGSYSLGSDAQAGDTFFFAGGGYNADSYTVNFGQRAFAYTAPSGFKALCTTNLPTPTVADGSEYFDATLYTGNGSTQSISVANHSPDLVWVKSRNDTTGHRLFDTVRGDYKFLESNSTGAEVTNTNQIAITSSGFDTGNSVNTNDNNDTYVAWTWDAGSSTASNTDGSITSSVRASATSGFSIVSYTGNGSNSTIGHGLNAAPEMIMIKKRSATQNWVVYHAGIGATKGVYLNSDSAPVTASNFFQNTDPTSSVFSVGTGNGVNTNNETFIAYCFAPVAGYSAFGEFTSNNTTDNVFLYTGFAPRYILWRITNTSGGWSIYDAARTPVNPNDTYLRANSANAEATATPGVMDFLSNGFKVRNTLGGTNSLIYMAFASNPFQANGGLAR